MAVSEGAMKWMQEAWNHVGQREIAGGEHNPEILQMFVDAGVPQVGDDETAWCAAFVGACLARNGIAPPPSWDAIRARSYSSIGQAIPINQPRVGAIAVFKRGRDPRLGHVGFVTGWTGTHIMLLGGNQSNAVNVTPYPRAQLLALRWPGAALGDKDLAKAGSRTVKAARRQRADAVKAAVPQAAPVPAPDVDPQAIAAKAREGMGLVDTVAEFGTFLQGKWPWIAAAVTLYFLARMAYDAGMISWFRRDDHNTGANPQREVLTAQIAQGGDGGGVDV